MLLLYMSHHPLIPNSQQYMLQYKYCTINSDDRDIKKYPNASEFEIELPQDYVNVQTVKLNSCIFPNKYDVFSHSHHNVIFQFSIRPYYMVGTVSTQDPKTDKTEFTIQIESGSYTPSQMATELTNRMNLVVSQYVSTINVDALYYKDFLVEYHEVSGKFWFGNVSSEFTLNNGSDSYLNDLIYLNNDCAKRAKYVEYINWGLPYYLGFSQEDVDSTPATNDTQMFYKSYSSWSTQFGNKIQHVVITNRKSSLAGPTHFYMEISGMNNMDETMPFSLDSFHKHTNETNGIVNSCFAKIPILTNESMTWYNERSESYMLYNPPAEKIRRLRIRMRHHTNRLVLFDQFEYSFVIQFGLFTPQNEKKYGVYVPESVNQNR
jgi:hypothetical protein